MAEEEAETGGERREEEKVMLGGDACSGWSRVRSWDTRGELFMPTGVPSCPRLVPFKLDSIITEKWMWQSPWDWQPSSPAHAVLRPSLVTCTHFTGHRQD